MSIPEINRKILTWAQARTQARSWQAGGRVLVFTNGCFDLLHVGHLRYLSRARALGDFLLVGLNSDHSVRQIKGSGRPITPQDQRAELLAGLETVDGVVVFEQPDPLALITYIGPDILVKGGDWPRERIIGRDVVEARGGRVLSIPLVPDVSTTQIIGRIQNLDGQTKETGFMNHNGDV